MSTITRELAKLFRKITNSEIDAEGNAHVVLSPADSLLINNARIALASLEAEAVACIDRANLDYLESGADADVWPASGAGSDDVLLYAAPQLPQPAVVVPGIKPDWMDNEFNAGWNSCRSAMLQAGNHTEQHLDMVDHSGDSNNMVEPVTTAYKLPDDFDFDRFNDVVWLEAVASNPHMHSLTTSTIAMVALELNRKLADCNSPVIPDDVRRMDWLVSKTVDVREPMVYGSHSIFWSQTITDEDDDYHATKLREQIDAAMAAEQAAAPQQEAE